MSSLHLQTISDTGRKLMAVLLFVALSFAILLAGIAQVAETPAAGASGSLGKVAPGALGMIRFELAKIGLARLDVDEVLARKALAGMPLSADPFAALAAVSLNDNPRGQTGRESALLAEALRRDPRNRPARILMLRLMAANGDLKGAFDQLAVFSRLNTGLVEVIMEAITVRIGTPRMVDDALGAIQGHPSLYLPFVNRMTVKRKPREVVLRLAEKLPSKIMAQPEIRSAIVRQLIDVGEFAVARQLWQQGNTGGPNGLVHSPDFADRKASPPFNWELVVSSTGAAEPDRSGGLSISYYDRNPGLLASQILTLAPGNYQGVIDYERIGGTADNVRLRVTCKGTGTVLGEASLIARKPGLNHVTVSIAVPGAACAGQSIEVVGVAAEDRGESQLLIKRIDVMSGGRAK